MSKKWTPAQPGGYRGTQGRKSLYPGKFEDYVKRSAILTRKASDAADALADQLSTSRLAARRNVKAVTFSDAVEYALRKAAGLSQEE